MLRTGERHRSIPRHFGRRGREQLSTGTPVVSCGFDVAMSDHPSHGRSAPELCRLDRILVRWFQRWRGTGNFRRGRS